MVTLRQLVNRQMFTGEEDSSLIAEWFNENNMSIQGLEIISKMAKKKIEDDEWKYGLLAGDLSMYAATENLITDFGVENGCKINSAITKWIVCFRVGDKFEEKYPTLFAWLKEFIPKQNQPSIFWQPFIKWMNENNIYFKDQKEKNCKRRIK